MSYLTDRINFMKDTNIRQIWDEAEAKYQQTLDEKGICVSRATAYLMIQQSMAEDRPVLPSLDGVETKVGGKIASPVTALEDLELRSDR